MDETNLPQTKKERIRKLIKKTEAKLRQIQILEAKDNKGLFLNERQIEKMNRKEEYEQLLLKLKKGDYIFDDEKDNDDNDNNNKKTRKQKDKDLKEVVNLLARKTSMDLSGILSNETLINIEIHDAVRLKSGDTGVVKYIGEVPFIPNQTVYGILMDAWHPSYGNGCIDGKRFFSAADGKFFILFLFSFYKKYTCFGQIKPNILSVISLYQH